MSSEILCKCSQCYLPKYVSMEVVETYSRDDSLCDVRHYSSYGSSSISNLYIPLNLGNIEVKGVLTDADGGTIETEPVIIPSSDLLFRTLDLDGSGSTLAPLSEMITDWTDRFPESPLCGSRDQELYLPLDAYPYPISELAEGTVSHCSYTIGLQGRNPNVSSWQNKGVKMWIDGSAQTGFVGVVRLYSLSCQLHNQQRYRSSFVNYAY